MEETGDGTIVCEGSQIASFAVVAKEARISEICYISNATMLLSNGMVYFMAKRCIIHADQAVLAAVLRSFADGAAVGCQDISSTQRPLHR